MAMKYHPLSLFISLLFCFFSLCLADIRHTKIRPKDSTPEDNPALIFIDTFGFTNTGRVELNLSHISFSNHPTNLNLSHQIGFFLVPRFTVLDNKLELDDHTICYLQSDFVSVLYTFDLENNDDVFLNLEFGFTHSDLFILYFANCLHPQLKSSMDIHSAMYNLQVKSGEHNYLSAENNYLIGIYFIFSFIYLLLTVLFQIHSLVHRKQNSNGVMLFCAVYKLMSFILELTYLYYMKHIGYSQSLVSVLLNSTLGSFGGILPLYIFLSLNAMGWPLMRKILLQENALFIIIPFRVAVNIICKVPIVITWPATFMKFSCLLILCSHIFDIVFLFIILDCVIVTTKYLLRNEHVEGEAAAVLRKAYETPTPASSKRMMPRVNIFHISKFQQPFKIRWE